MVEKGAAKRSEDLDNLGGYNFSKSVNFDPAQSQTLDTRDTGRQFHGANQDFELSPNAEYGGSMMNIYGDGLYVTDDYETASSYVKKNRVKGKETTGGVYEVTSENQNLYDLNAPLDAEAKAYLDDYVDTSKYDEMAELIEEALSENPESLADVMDYMRGNSRGFNIPASEIQEVFNDIKNIFKKKGFNGYTHVGGLKAGKGKRQHKVNILWDADTNSSMRKTADDEFTQMPEIEEPIFGLHDLYGYEESGIRSADDMGIVGASIDQVRIAKNIDSTHGRLGSVMTEPAMKFALEGVEEYESVLKGLRETLVEADELGYRVKGRTITAKEVQDEGMRFAANLNQMDIDQMRQFLDDNRPDIAGQTLNEVAAKGVRLAIKESMQELKASALIRGSLAGQVSDMAQGARFAEGTATTIRSEEQIIDRLEFLMIQNGKDSYSKGRALSMLNMSKRSTPPTASQLKKQGADALTRIKAEAKATADVLREIKDTKPEMLNPLLLAYEATDGKVGTIDALNNYFRQSTGVIKKAVVDGQPDIPSVVMAGFWSNVYNSTLSAFATPIKAAVSAGALLIERPVATFAGAMMHGDGATLRRGLYQYGASQMPYRRV